MSKLLDWLDHRTGCRKLTREALFENVPGGARWRYVWGSTLTFTFVIQIITGFALWAAYSPSSQTAWESVFYIQNHMIGGWILRGIHHYTAQAMNILLVLHLVQVIIDGAYKAPREVNYWFGLLLLVLVLGLSLTGYLLPWDQKGYWATKVATNIAAITPFVGTAVQKIIIGGVDYGHHTLTRFFALHAGVLPGAVIVLIVGHIALFRRHGITAKKPYRKPDAAFWPDQMLIDAIACLAVMAAVMVLVLKNHGAELGPPADPSENFSAARPEWYFLFLFQFLKYFPGGTEVLGAIAIPSVIMLLLFLMPVIGRKSGGHKFNIALLFALIAGAALLTYVAIREDRGRPEIVAAKTQAEESAARIKDLANAPEGIPPTGAVSLLRTDPFTQGPKLFAKYCASCHRYDGHDGTGLKLKEAPTASDLKGFGSREWLTGLLDPNQVSGAHYFGGTKFKNGKMVKFVTRKLRAFSPEQKADLTNVIAAVSAEAGLKSQKELDASSSAQIQHGLQSFNEGVGCAECHQLRSKNADASGPDLTRWGSREWLVGVTSNPKSAHYYGDDNDRMPAFADDKVLDAVSIGLIADWLRGEWYEPTESAQAKAP
ncbi:MAG: menaquinol-cytochrome reductase [Verrucomicrobiales bacterium]|nr:menaquinol-cytochrome reductase [Verrucomicrobiales bacterium]